MERRNSRSYIIAGLAGAIFFAIWGFRQLPFVYPEHGFTKQKREIIESLEQETFHFCNRNFDKWASYWVQRPSTFKYYVRECEYEELKGFATIEQYVASYFQENKDPEPVPAQNYSYEIQIDDEAAWVFYEVYDELRGFKKEFRYLLYKGGKWKIASMGTIYP